MSYPCKKRGKCPHPVRAWVCVCERVTIVILLRYSWTKRSLTCLTTVKQVGVVDIAVIMKLTAGL